jgi:glycosyltransferase involved in cell wall biosynthesis
LPGAPGERCYLRAAEIELLPARAEWMFDIYTAFRFRHSNRRCMTHDAVSFTIITSTLNCRDALVKTIDSIRRQSCRSVQWIIADGGSTDGTVDLIRRNADVVEDWFSEPDQGIYDAWNKACRLIRGDWVLFLGAGDTLAEAATLALVEQAVGRLPPTTLIAYGDVVQRVAGDIVYCFGEVDLAGWQLYRPALPAHQGTFHRAEILRDGRPFDTSYRIAGDSKLLLQVVRPELVHYLGLDVADMEPGGISSHPASSIKVMKEFLRLESDIGYRIPFWRRSWFIVRSCIKFATFSLAGSRAVSNVALLKKRLAGNRV